MLNGTSAPSKFRFREKEIERIKSFVDDCLNQQKKGFKFMMITGAPGAGKSLCANSVLSKIDCKIIKLNANVVKSLTEVQEIVA
jgi:Cdc6-like AAA superfamily ATPase